MYGLLNVWPKLTSYPGSRVIASSVNSAGGWAGPARASSARPFKWQPFSGASLLKEEGRHRGVKLVRRDPATHAAVERPFEHGDLLLCTRTPADEKKLARLIGRNRQADLLVCQPRGQVARS